MKAFGSGEAARVKDARGRCALHFAAQIGRDDSCEYLLHEGGFHINAQDESGAPWPSRYGRCIVLNAHHWHA